MRIDTGHLALGSYWEDMYMKKLFLGLILLGVAEANANAAGDACDGYGGPHTCDMSSFGRPSGGSSGACKLEWERLGSSTTFDSASFQFDCIGAFLSTNYCAIKDNNGNPIERYLCLDGSVRPIQ